MNRTDAGCPHDAYWVRLRPTRHGTYTCRFRVEEYKTWRMRRAIRRLLEAA